MGNTLVRSVATKSIFESAQAVVDSGLSCSQGDLLCFDTSTKKIVVPTLETQGNLFLGAARDTLVSGKLPSPYTTDVDAAQAFSDIGGPLYGSIFACKLKAGDTLNPGDLVYLYPAPGAQFVQASGTKAIGVYQGPSVVTGGPSDNPTSVNVLLGARYPEDTLRF